LRHERQRNGSIFFDKAEVKFKLDDEGNPIGVFFKTQKDAHKLIEDFMLLANKKVAEFIGGKNETAGKSSAKDRPVLGGSLKSLALMRECPKARSG
jgi:hypothetical protein